MDDEPRILPFPRNRPAGSCELTRLRAALNALLDEDLAVADLCLSAVNAVDAIRAELDAAPRWAKGPIRRRLAVADSDLARVGYLALSIDARIAAARAAIDRAVCPSPRGSR